jgi:hypothetical protein
LHSVAQCASNILQRIAAMVRVVWLLGCMVLLQCILVVMAMHVSQLKQLVSLIRLNA